MSRVSVSRSLSFRRNDEQLSPAKPAKLTKHQQPPGHSGGFFISRWGGLFLKHKKMFVHYKEEIRLFGLLDPKPGGGVTSRISYDCNLCKASDNFPVSFFLLRAMG